MTATTPSNEGFIQTEITWVRRAGIVSLFIYALFWLMNIEISRAGEGLMVLFFLLAMFTGGHKTLVTEPVFYLLIAWVLFQIGVYDWSSQVFPELKSDHIREARVLTNVFMFVIVAWWMGGNTKRIVTVLALCTIGYLIGATFQTGGLLDEIWKFDEHKRLTLGYINWEHASVYSAFVFLFLLTLQGRINSYVPTKFRWYSRTLIYLAITYSAIAIIATQTRATWLALSITGTAFVIGYTLYKVRTLMNDKTGATKPFGSKSFLYIAIVVTSIFTLAYTFNAQNLITKRINAEKDVINKLLEGDTENVRLSSIGIRIAIWELGNEWFKQRPLTGWGPQSRKTLLLQSDLPDRVKKNIRHLHNSYIELLVAYGIIGLGVFAALFVYIWSNALKAWKANYIPNDVMLFAGLWSIYWLIVNFFESYVIYSATGNYLNAIVAGILFTYHLQKRQSEKPYKRVATS